MPSITSWTRLEPHCRNSEMDTSVQARVYDPLWMMARQWQVGEFQGEDSGTPVMARLRAESAKLTRYFSGAIAPNTRANAPLYDGNHVPLETLVERETIRPATTAKPEKLRLAAEAGQHFLRFLEQQILSRNYRDTFIRNFPFPALTTEQRSTLDNDSRSLLDLLLPRVPDGRQLATTFRAAGGGNIVISPVLQIAPADVAEVEKAARLWLQWFDTLFSEPATSNPSWLPERMEYSFSVGTRLSDGERILTAQEYFDGSLDWYAFDGNAEVTLGGAADNTVTEITRTVIPAPVSFRGAPTIRFWEFEDARIDYSAIQTGPTDLPHLLLIEFANSYGNDWFVIPVELEVGSLCRTRSLVVTDTFGVRTLIKSSSESGLPHSLWRMFQTSYLRDSGITVPASNQFFLPPTIVKNIEGRPLEEVLFLRDEMANLAWGVERIIESPIEQPLNSYEAEQQRGAGASSTIPPASELAVYRLSSTVPNYWVPLLPMQIDAATQAIRLVRGAVLKPDGTQQIVNARGRILNPDQQQRLAIFEEEVPREGVRVTRNYQMTRWMDGSTHLWVGRRKEIGSGEGSSGLRFDTAES